MFGKETKIYQNAFFWEGERDRGNGGEVFE